MMNKLEQVNIISDIHIMNDSQEVNTITDFSDILLEEPTPDFFNNNFDYDQDLRLQSQWVAQWQSKQEPWGGDPCTAPRGGRTWGFTGALPRPGALY